MHRKFWLRKWIESLYPNIIAPLIVSLLATIILSIWSLIQFGNILHSLLIRISLPIWFIILIITILSIVIIYHIKLKTQLNVFKKEPNFSYHDNAYWIEKDRNKNEGPYCISCKQYKNKWLLMFPVIGTYRTWKCNVCGNKVASIDHTPPANTKPGLVHFNNNSLDPF